MMGGLSDELIKAVERAVSDLGKQGDGSVTLHIRGGRVRQIETHKLELISAAPMGTTDKR